MKKLNRLKFIRHATIIQFEDEQRREYRMNVRRICMILCNVAETYYKENRDKFHFNYEIIDWDEVTSHLLPIDMDKFFAELARSGKEIYQEKKVGENE